MWETIFLVLQVLVVIIGIGITFLVVTTKTRTERLKNSDVYVLTVHLKGVAACVPFKLYIPNQSSKFLENMTIVIRKKLANLQAHWAEEKEDFRSNWQSRAKDVRNDLIKTLLEELSENLDAYTPQISLAPILCMRLAFANLINEKEDEGIVRVLAKLEEKNFLESLKDENEVKVLIVTGPVDEKDQKITSNEGNKGETRCSDIPVEERENCGNADVSKAVVKEPKKVVQIDGKMNQTAQDLLNNLQSLAYILFLQQVDKLIVLQARYS